MGKAVKTIAKVAVVAAAAYYGGAYLMGAAAPAAGPAGYAFTTAGGVGTATSAFGSSFAGKLASSAFNYVKANPFSTGSFALRSGGMFQQNKYATEAASYNQVIADAKVEENKTRQRISEVNARNVANAKNQQKMIMQGRNLVANSGFSSTGTSSYVGTQGALNTDYASVIGDLNVSRGFAADLSTQANIIGQAGTDRSTAQGFASGAGNITTAGMNIFKTISGGDGGLYSRSLTPIA